jgi:hypothetical protein
MAKYVDPSREQIQESISWFKKNIGVFTSSGNFKQKFVRRPAPGTMLSFTYKPKMAAKLDYYDTFPLIVVMDKKDKGFLGMNLHYLPPRYRSLMVYRLLNIQSRKDYDEYSRIKASYSIIKRYAGLKAVIPCIRHYKNNRIRSKIMQVPMSDWYLAVSLPTARFKNASRSKVWTDSINKIV